MEESTKKTCSIGQGLRRKCSQDARFKLRHHFSEREIDLLQRRSNCPQIRSVCSRHDKLFRVLYSAKQMSCCNPLNRHPKLKKSKSLWTITKQLDRQCRSVLPKVIEGRKLCPTCKMMVLKSLPAPRSSRCASPEYGHQDESTSPSGRQPSTDKALVQQSAGAEAETAVSSQNLCQSQASLASVSGHGESSASIYSPTRAILERVSKSIVTLGESPIVPKKAVRSKKYARKKFQKAESVLRASLEKAVGSKLAENSSASSTDDEGPTDYKVAGKEILKQLKRKYDDAASNSDFVTILSLLPASWSKQQIMRYFGATKYMVEKMRDCVKEQGILCTPNPAKGKPLPEKTIRAVQKFFREPDISREMPGSKEFKSVKEDGKRVHKQKKLVLGNLREIYESFKEKYRFEPDIKVGFSKFCEVRPAECVLAGASGTHAVCVCLIHQNFKLMFVGSKLGQLTSPDGQLRLFSDYRSCLSSTLCSNPTALCHLGGCEKCPDVEGLKETLIQLFQNNYIDTVTYSQWIKVDRCSLEGLTSNTEDFIEKFVECIPNVIKHDYIAKRQSEYFKSTRDGLEVGDVLVVPDFSENYSFVLQDSVQGMHWNNIQATVHPFACYYRPLEGSDIVPLNFVIISDSLVHSTSSVHAFQREFLVFLHEKVPNLKKVIYFSDGAASQYKNRYNMLNVLRHFKDFGVAAEWHFFATSHGKGPSDGLGGTLKRLAARASLQCTYEDQIKSPTDLYNWAKKNIKGMHVHYVPDVSIKREQKMLARRFKKAPAIKGIRKYHGAIPMSANIIKMKILSESTAETNFKLITYR